jgi:hypothetical protein
MNNPLAIELPRSFLQRFLRVFRKGGLHRTPKAGSVEVHVKDGVVTLRSANNVLDLECRCECHEPEPDWTFHLSPDVLSICGARLADTVVLRKESAETVRATWFDAGIPQEAEFDVLTPGPEPIPEPERTTSPQWLIAALKDAADSVDELSSRYALGCIELSGVKKRIAATDSRQLLVQEGFEFPWDGVRLMRSSAVFGAPDLPVVGNLPLIGESGEWIVVRLGEWRISHAIERDARFPDVDLVVPSRTSVEATMRIEPRDSAFLMQRLSKLPCGDPLNEPVTVDLNGSVAIRARKDSASSPTELVLSRSERVGNEYRTQVNRRYLDRALNLGFREVGFGRDGGPVLACDETRRFVWMGLGEEGVIHASEPQHRIESAPYRPKANPRRRSERTLPA